METDLFTTEQLQLIKGLCKNQIKILIPIVQYSLSLNTNPKLGDKDMHILDILISIEELIRRRYPNV